MFLRHLLATTILAACLQIVCYESKKLLGVHIIAPKPVSLYFYLSNAVNINAT